jgi:hypothetical protein
MKSLDEARKSYGTDEDILLVRAVICCVLTSDFILLCSCFVPSPAEVCYSPTVRLTKALFGSILVS